MMVKGNPHTNDAAGGCCLACYNTQQRLANPFWVFCPHRGALVCVYRTAYESWPVSVEQVLETVAGA